jgi:hypothetical protein
VPVLLLVTFRTSTPLVKKDGAVTAAPPETAMFSVSVPAPPEIESPLVRVWVVALEVSTALNVSLPAPPVMLSRPVVSVTIRTLPISR